MIHLNKILQEIDKILALLGCIIAPILAVYTQVIIKTPLYTVAVVISFFACLTYLYLRKDFSNISLLPQIQTNISIHLILNILFLFLFTCSVLVLYFRPEVYVRPLAYFILMALMGVVVSMEIRYTPPKKIYSYSILFQIILIGLFLVWSELLIFPTIIGEDPFAHRIFTLDILNSGYIPEDFAYSKLPIFHLIIGVTSLITGLNYKMATMLSISLLQVVCDVLFIFLLGRYMFNTKIGLLGALLVIIGNRHIRMGFEAMPNTIAAIFIPIIIYLLFKLRKEKPLIGTSLAILFMVSLILTHTVTAMWMAILLLVFWMGFEVYNAIYYEHGTPVTLTIITFFTVVMFGWWTYASGHISTLAGLLKWGYSTDVLLHHIPSAIAYTLPLSEQMYNNFGMFLFFAFSFVGCFYMLSKYGNSCSFSMAMGGLLTIMITFSGPVLHRYIIVGRWEYFSYIILAIPLAIAIFLLYKRIKNELVNISLLSTFIFFLVFLMITSPIANVDNLTFSPNATLRYGFTDSELQAVNTISNIWDGTVYMDCLYTVIGSDFAQVKSADKMLYNTDFRRCKDTPILIRKEIIGKPVDMFRNIFKLEYDPSEFLTEQGFSRIYDCSSVYGYCNISSSG